MNKSIIFAQWTIILWIKTFFNCFALKRTHLPAPPEAGTAAGRPGKLVFYSTNKTPQNCCGVLDIFRCLR